MNLLVRVCVYTQEISGDKLFGVQLASNDVDELLRSADIVAESGASFIDLNCG